MSDKRTNYFPFVDVNNMYVIESMYSHYQGKVRSPSSSTDLHRRSWSASARIRTAQQRLSAAAATLSRTPMDVKPT
jgi:hypothetical protein